MAGRERRGAELARGLEQIAELDRAVALDAGHRRLARGVAVGEIVDHRLAEAALVVQHVMRDADPLGDVARVVDVLAGAAGALAMGGRAMIVELQRDADDVVAFRLQQRSRHRGIDAAGHGDDDPGVLRTAFEIQTVEHGSGHRCDRGGIERCRDQEQRLAAGSGSGIALPERLKSRSLI